MANQLGTINVGAQLATEQVTESSTTDRSYFGLSSSTAAQTAAPDWDRYQLWGVQNGYPTASASAIPANRIITIPHWFNRTGRIKTITTLVSSAIGNPSVCVLGIFGNSLDGRVYPGSRLYQSSEIAVNSGGASVAIIASPDYLVSAGTLLHFAIAVGTANLSPLVGVGCAAMEGLYGTKGVGGAFASASDFDLVCGLRVTATYGTTPNFLPATFPTTGTIAEFGANQAAGLTNMPVFAFRFVKN